ncbi:hypothetical protein [Sicyoidochytrium minutum DNA virus]|nr:hypothetical protein [Sicyoidochytrium minutum DNA virus]
MEDATEKEKKVQNGNSGSLTAEERQVKPACVTFAEVYSEQDRTCQKDFWFEQRIDDEQPFYGGEPRHFIDSKAALVRKAGDKVKD